MVLTATGRELRLSADADHWPTATGLSTRTGSQGNDIFYSGSAETLRGLGGDDTYTLFSNAAVVQEMSSSGIDTIIAQFWGVAALAANVENLVLGSFGAYGAIGNELDNIIVAGAMGASLWGMGGDDVLVGGVGADIYRIVAGQGSDAIIGFQSGWDAVDLQGYGISTFSELLTASRQVGDDVQINFGNGEILVLRDIELRTLTASDFNMHDAPRVTGADQINLSGPTTVLHSNGWSALNNTWGSSGLVYGADYVMQSAASRADMTEGTVFTWSYGLTANPYAQVLAYPEVTYGFNPYANLANATATSAGFPAFVQDIVQLDLDYSVSIGGHVAGFNVAYDIWFTDRPHGTAEDITTELMIWVHRGTAAAFGAVVGEYVDGDFRAQIYNTGTYIALVVDSDRLSGTIDVVAIIDYLVELGLMSRSEYLSCIELGSEVFSGSGSLTINNFDFTLATQDSDGRVTVAEVTGSGTTVSHHDPVVVTDNIYQLDDRFGDVVGSALIDTILSTVSRDLNNHLNVENLTLQGNANIDAVGNSLSNILIGNSGNNVLDGRAGADILQGGLGNDTYVLGNDTSDTVVDTGGVDTITSTVSMDLNNYADIENLILLGRANSKATGNASANLLVGNVGDNVLDGGAGNDRLIGGEGRDVLTGGLGQDTFVFKATSESSMGAADRITDFTVGEDIIDVSGIDALAMSGTRPGGFCGVGNFSHGAVKIYQFHEIVNGTETTRVELDMDRDGRPDFQLLLDGNIHLSASDFYF